MQMKFEPTAPDRIDFTLTITMPLGDWKKLKTQLPHVYPASQINDKIYDMMRKAVKHFEPDEQIEIEK